MKLLNLKTLFFKLGRYKKIKIDMYLKKKKIKFFSLKYLQLDNSKRRNRVNNYSHPVSYML